VRVIGAQRELSWVVGDTLLPFLSVAAYVFIYRGMGAPEEYTGFVVLGGLLMTFWMHMIWSMGMQLFWEKETGNLERYLMAPMPRPALLLGMALGGIWMTATRAAIIYIASRLWFKITFPMSDPWLSLVIFLAAMGALYGMGMAVSSLFFMAGRGIFNLLGLMADPIFFLGGFYFPVKYLGYIAFAAAALVPTTLGLDALRQTMLGVYHTGLFTPPLELAALVVMAIAFTWFSVWAVNKMEEIGRREGKLILRNQ